MRGTVVDGCLWCTVHDRYSPCRLLYSQLVWGRARAGTRMHVCATCLRVRRSGRKRMATYPSRVSATRSRTRCFVLPHLYVILQYHALHTQALLYRHNETKNAFRKSNASKRRYKKTRSPGPTFTFPMSMSMSMCLSVTVVNSRHKVARRSQKNAAASIDEKADDGLRRAVGCR